VGDTLIDMPLFLDPDKYVAVPLEEIYQLALAHSCSAKLQIR
jgi:hypothetical protein